MPVFWHFRVLFSLQTFLRPLIFDTLFRTEVKQVCNAISAIQLSQICSSAVCALKADNIPHQADKNGIESIGFPSTLSLQAPANATYPHPAVEDIFSELE